MRSLIFFFILCSSALARDYHFDTTISEPVLRNYLARAVTFQYLLTRGDIDEHIRMLTNCGVKFAGRAVYNWGREEGGESAIPKKLERAKTNAEKIHATDPDLVLQACIFEIISADVNNLAIPAWTFQALNQPVEQRSFRFADMTYPSGRGTNQWGQNSAIPDVSRLETKLFFYYLAASYIDIGCEAIHYGQVELMNGNDRDLTHWSEVLTLARQYANKKARRHFLMIDAHVPNHGLVKDGKLLLDFHTFPLRIAEIPDKPKQAELRVGHTDALYGKSKGGLTPSGWKTEHLPYLVEFDNYGRSRMPGQPNQGRFWIWGWDEITWLSQQTEPDRNAWLKYAWAWVRKNDPAGYVQMPMARVISGGPNNTRWYSAAPTAFNQEQAIKQIWQSDP